MKKFINLLHVKENNIVSLQEKLLQKLRERSNIRMQLKLGQLKKFHILRKMNRNIASIKYSLSKK